MAHNPLYHHWIFRRPANSQVREHVQISFGEAGEAHIIREEREEVERHLQIRRRIEMFEEAKLLKHNLNDLW